MNRFLNALSLAALPGIALLTTSCGNKTDTYSATNTGASPYGNSPYYGPSGGYDSGAATPAAPASDPYTGTTSGGGYTPPPPAPTPAPAPYTGGSTGGSVSHTVVTGDTLYGLSRRYGTTVSAIQSANGLSDSNIRLGSTLNIPQ